MATSSVFGARPRRAKPEKTGRTGGRGRKLGLIAALSSSLVLAGGFAFADTATPTPTPSEAPLTAPADPEVTASVEPTQAPEPTTEASPEPEETLTPEPVASPTPSDEAATPSGKPTGTKKAVTSDPAIAQDTANVAPLAQGPDGGTAPYVYWSVKDAQGNPVSGATFKFEYRSWSSWTSGDNASALSDCQGTCPLNTGGDSLDRDSDGGEFLLEHRGTTRNSANRITENSNYRVTPVSAPPGFVWESTAAKSINVNSNSATWNNIYDFGSFIVTKVQTAPVCTAGYVYAISATGQLQQVASNGAVTDLGTSARSSNMNGLGIGAAGQLVYAVQRSSTSSTNQSGTIWKYDITTGMWSSTGVNSGGTSTNLIGGAVDLSSGLYYFGGFTAGGDFRVYEYNPAASPQTKLKATVTTTATSSANGDMAFDAAGNLYIVRGDGSNSIIYSVTKAAFQGANGGSIASQATNPFSTSSDVNGVAFDSTGKAFLGSSSQLRSYDMPNWSNSATVVNSGLDSTDLATCSSPPTIVIEKEIVGGRAKASDQFKLTLNQGSTQLAETTTEGSAIGVQSQRIGPLPTVRNVELKFAEIGANGTALGDYASAYQCTVTYLDGTVQNLQQVTATSGSITIPSTGDAVRCVFRNSPLVANVKIHKDVTDALGVNPTARQGWTVGASSVATTGTVSTAPSTTQATDADGNAAWKLTFGAYSARATVTVREQMQSGYEFLSGRCVVTSLTGAQTTTTLTGPDNTALAGIQPGDSVDCIYTNKPTGATLAITKAFDSTVPTGSETSTVFSGTYACILNSATVASGTWSRTGTGAATLTPAVGSPAANQIPAGASCSATETPLTGSTGLPNGSWEWGTASIAPSAVTLASGQTSTITVTNKAKRVYGLIQISKIVPEGSLVDAGRTFNGGWSCTLGAETVTGSWGPLAAGSTWTATAADKIPLGATCTATENRTGEPVADGSHVWDGEPVISAEVTVVSGQTAKITITNKTRPVPGTVAWVKVAKGGQTPLKGSEWKIVGPAPATTETAVTDCVAADATGCTGPDKEPAAGKFLIKELAWGAYSLIETKAPPGYLVNTTPVQFTVGRTDGNNVKLEWNLGNIENEQRDAPILPLTGGIGRDQIYLAGAAVLLLAMTAYGTKRYLGRRHPRSA